VVLDDVEQAFAGDLPELGGQVDDRVHHREVAGAVHRNDAPKLAPALA
jgi:hypothetical protein